MTTQISPMLAVSDGKAAIAFYQQAFGATLLWELEGAEPDFRLTRPNFSCGRIPPNRHAKPGLRRVYHGEH